MEVIVRVPHPEVRPAPSWVRRAPLATRRSCRYELVKAAEQLTASIKFLEQLAAGNHKFSKAEKALRASVEALALAEVRYFLDTFVPSFKRTLDELG